MNYVTVVIALHRYAAAIRTYLNDHGNAALDRRVDNRLTNVNDDEVAINVREENAHKELQKALAVVKAAREDAQVERSAIFADAANDRAALNA